MKGVTEIFISKEKLAIFWFLASVGCVVFTAWHLHDLAVTSRGSRLYVPIENSFYYLDRTQSTESRDELLAYHVRLSLESYLNRGPRGPLRAERLNLLFNEEGLADALADVQQKRFDFRNQQIHQMVEVGELNLSFDTDLSAVSTAAGQIIQVSTDPVSNETVTKAYTFRAVQNWKRNRNLRYSRRFAWVCTDVEYEMVEISSSTDQPEEPTTPDETPGKAE